jgi:hypothetical protein
MAGKEFIGRGGDLVWLVFLTTYVKLAGGHLAVL